MGRMALAASLIQLDIPSTMTSAPWYTLPPPVQTIMDNLMPKVFTRALWNRALGHASDAIYTPSMVTLSLSISKVKVSRIIKPLTPIYLDSEKYYCGSCGAY